MFQPRKYKKKELLEIFRTRNDNALLALIDSLWREYPAQWKEQKLSLADIDKADPTHADYDARYKYARNDFRNADNSQTTSYATAHGFGHVARADFAQAFGFFNYALSFFQTTMGPFAKIPENQTPDEWINTDLLYVLGNGQDEANRSNVVEIFKSGLVHWHNAQVIGAYEHGNEGEPAPELIPGLIQYTAANGFECVKEDLQWHPFGESAYEIAVRNGFVGTEIEWLASLQGADGDDGAPGSDGAPGVDGTDGKSAYEVAVDNGFVGTEAEWLASLEGADGDPAPDTFIGLSDTSETYPSTNKGQLIKQNGAEEVGFAEQIGEDTLGPWLKKTKSTTSTILTSYTKTGEDGKFWATTVGDKLRFEGSVNAEAANQGYNVDVYVDGVKVKTIKSDGSTFYIYHEATAAETHVWCDYTGEPGTVNYSYALYLVEVISETGGLQLLGNSETIGLLNWYRNDLSKKIIDLAGLLKLNKTDGYVTINDIQYPTSIPATTKYLALRPDGKIELLDIEGLLPEGNNGDMLRYNEGWENLPKSSNGKLLQLIEGLPGWGDLPGHEHYWEKTVQELPDKEVYTLTDSLLYAFAKITVDQNAGSRGIDFELSAQDDVNIKLKGCTISALADGKFQISVGATNGIRIDTDGNVTMGHNVDIFKLKLGDGTYPYTFPTSCSGANGKVLKMNTTSGELEWQLISELPTGATGDILYHNGTSWVKLAKGANGKVLKINNDLPSWQDDVTGGGIPGTETLSGTSVTVSWNGKTAASLTLTGATTITFGTPANYVKRLFVTGDYSLTLPASCKLIAGEYDGTVTNIIDLIPQPDGTVWVTINQEG